VSLIPPPKLQKLQAALHAKAKASPSQRFHTLYDKVYRRDVLSGYFDSIPHAQLMQCLRRRIVDGAMLHLLKMWLEMPVEEIDEHGNRNRTTRNKDEGKGTPQGAPISPLLSNLYMRRFVLGWKALGHEAHLKARIVNYADDFVICCRGTAHQAMTLMRAMMQKLKLTVNESKTHVREMPGETFDFLGYTFGRHRSNRTGRWMLCGKPSRKRIARVCEKISAMTSRSTVTLSAAEMVAELNPVLRGWAGYFRLGPISDVYRTINAHVRYRFRKWWIAKHKNVRLDVRWHWSRWLEQEFGLLELRWDPGRLPHAKA